MKFALAWLLTSVLWGHGATASAFDYPGTLENGSVGILHASYHLVREDSGLTCRTLIFVVEDREFGEVQGKLMAQTSFTEVQIDELKEMKSYVAQLRVCADGYIVGHLKDEKTRVVVVSKSFADEHFLDEGE